MQINTFVPNLIRAIAVETVLNAVRTGLDAFEFFLSSPTGIPPNVQTHHRQIPNAKRLYRAASPTEQELAEFTMNLIADAVELRDLPRGVPYAVHVTVYTDAIDVRVRLDKLPFVKTRLLKKDLAMESAVTHTVRQLEARPISGSELPPLPAQMLDMVGRAAADPQQTWVQAFHPVSSKDIH